MTPKQLRLKKQKEAKREYKLARKFETKDFIRLRNYTFNELTSLNKRKFDCGVLKVALLP